MLMKFKPKWPRLALLGLGVCLISLGLALTAGADPVSTNSPPATTTTSPAAAAAPVKNQISGAELYSMHCNRCHAERYPTERTAAQWNTILLHMRVRANLPGQQARQILKYLQENSGR